MKFYILDKDFSLFSQRDKRSLRQLDSATSVAAYKQWFFECISLFGRIIPIDESCSGERLSRLLKEKGAILLSINILSRNAKWSKIPQRILQLSLGSLLLPDNLYNMQYLPSAQVHLLSTQFQLERIKSYLGRLAPQMEVFAPKIDTDFFIPPDKQERLEARRKQAILKEEVHIVYAGRWVMTKGICQLIRILDIWPRPNIILTLVGNIENENRLAFSLAQHKNFLGFLNEEVFRKKPRPWLRFQDPKNRMELRELFWSADIFVHPSIQPDENFGITPREALSCGVPVVTTDFCGLRPLAESMPWKGVGTYPTLFGPRFSLRNFSAVLAKAIKERKILSPAQYHHYVTNECNTRVCRENLARAIRYLLQKPAQIPIDTEKFALKIKRKLLDNIDDKAFGSFVDARKELPPGAYVYGDGPLHYAFAIVQGMYSSINSPPHVEKKTKWRGFFRITLWPKERALLEFGYPGPRIRRYPAKIWGSLTKCAYPDVLDEYVFMPKDKTQIKIIQELVDLGYLVSDEKHCLQDF